MPSAPDTANARGLQIFAWGLSSLVAAIAFIGWAASWQWEFEDINAYTFFPLLGLLAFSLMWSHYAVSVVRQMLGIDKKVLKSYIEITGFMVLALILLHPGLLVWQLWSDGFGLPPGSTKRYVGGAMYGSIVIAIIALVLFLLYELRRKFDKKPWWIGFVIATDFAMVLIYVHGLRLGGQLQTGWLRGVWYFYGVTLAAALVYGYTKRFTAKRPSA